MNREELEKLRNRIDELDDALALLLERRQEIARAIGEAKNGVHIYDPVRENEVVRGIQSRHPGISPRSLAVIMREVISLCRSIQSRPRVSFLGPEGSYSQQAAFAALGRDIVQVHKRDPREILLSVQQEEADLAVLAVENTTEGVVYATLDALSESSPEIRILREVRLPVRHVLAGPMESLREIREVRSHPQALAQCRLWLSTRLPGIPLKVASSTSEAASLAASGEGAAAICNELAAEMLNIPVLARNIQDQPHNTTRFWVAGLGETRPSEGSKTSLLFNVSHTPGSLLRALDPLRDEGLNLTFIQSRPMPGNPFEYTFFADIEGHAGEEPLARALEAMRPRCFRMRVLGSYPCGE